jgi:hypothetical protein
MLTLDNVSVTENVPDASEFLGSTVNIWDDILFLKKDYFLPMASLQRQRILLVIH